MFTIASTQVREPNFYSDVSISIPLSSSVYKIFTYTETNLNSSSITLFTSSSQYYSGSEYLIFTFNNLSVTEIDAKNELTSKLEFLNFDPNKRIYILKNISDNESTFYIKSYTIDNFVRYLNSYPYIIQVNFTFDSIDVYALAKTRTTSLTINSNRYTDINYVICKK